MTTIESWLEQIGLAKYIPTFVESEITYDLLPQLTESDIAKLDLPVGSQRRLLSAIAALNGNGHRETDVRSSVSHPSRRAELRQLTVMFCDVVGYTEMTTRLDLEKLDRLMEDYERVCLEVVLRFEGHVAQYLGDGVMAYFGKPVAHEDDAERSVHAALEIVRAVQCIPADQPLAVRIGVATGMVVVGEIARPADSVGGFARGSTPNLAFRLQQLAGPNEVVIGDITRRLVGASFDLEDLGGHPLKGFAALMRAWRVNDTRRAPSRFEAARLGSELTPFVGRQRELDTLMQAWTSTCQGAGRVMLISGEPGLGKSRLTRAFRERIAPDTFGLLTYQCLPHHSNSALYPIIQQLELSAGFSRDDSGKQKLEKLKTFLETGPASRKEKDKEEVTLLASMLGLPVQDLPSSDLSLRRRKDLTLQLIIDRIEALSRIQPMLVLIEDAQWIDPTTEEVLDLLVRRAPRMAVLVLITFRPAYKPSWTDLDHVASLMLAHLEPAQVEEMVRLVATGTPLPCGVHEEIVQRADGVPLFVEELTRSVLESWLLDGSDANPGTDAAVARVIPATLQDALAARLDRPEPEKRVLQCGACIGRSFPVRLLERIAEPNIALQETLRSLTESGLIFGHGQEGDLAYTFKHALLQDAAYRSLMPERRQRIHAGIASAFEEDSAQGGSVAPEILAYHYTEARNLIPAIGKWKQAGELALKSVAYRESDAHFRKALDLLHSLPPSAERDELELSIRRPRNGTLIAYRGWAAESVRENAAAVLGVAERQRGSENLLAGLYGVWISTLTQGRVAEACAVAQRMHREGVQMQDIDLRVLGHTACMISHLYMGELDLARTHGLQADALYDPARAERWARLTGHDTRSVFLCWRAQWTWMAGFPDEAARVCEQMEGHARAFGHVLDLGYALTVGAYPFDYRKEPEALFRRARDAERIAREHAIPILHEVMVPQVDGLAHLRGRQFSQAVVLLNEGIDKWRQLNGRTRVPYLRAALAEALAEQGELDRALATVDQALEQIEEPGCQERCHWSEVLRIKAQILMQMERAAEAESCLHQSIQWARGQGARSWELRSATTLALLLSRQGARSAARDVLAPVYSGFTEGFDTHDLRVARSLLHALL